MEQLAEKTAHLVIRDPGPDEDYARLEVWATDCCVWRMLFRPDILEARLAAYKSARDFLTEQGLVEVQEEVFHGSETQ